MTPVTENPLLEASFLQRLQRLQLLVRRPLPGQWKGEHRSPKRGYSVEFADFREYSPGEHGFAPRGARQRGHPRTVLPGNRAS
jgi:hypothetical protein